MATSREEIQDKICYKGKGGARWWIERNLLIKSVFALSCSLRRNRIGQAAAAAGLRGARFGCRRCFDRRSRTGAAQAGIERRDSTGLLIVRRCCAGHRSITPGCQRRALVCTHTANVTSSLRVKSSQAAGGSIGPLRSHPE